MEKVNCALIMAGGKGTRFWPKSTENKPKQFLKLVGNKTMIQETYERINRKVPSTQIFVVTCEKYKKLVMEQLPYISEKNIILEPVGKNTAPCILLASIYIKQIYNNANIAVFPSDHIILNVDEFINILDAAYNFVEANKKAIVTIGIKPDRPETGYGYIKCLDKNDYLNNMNIIKVEKFIEKPDLETAKKYLDEGKYLWNAGMFIFNCDFMLVELKKNLEKSYNLLMNLPSISSKDYYTELKKAYVKCEAISIDYAVMEKSDDIYVIPSEFGWDDIGTWKSLQRYIKPDNESNVIKGDVKIYNSSNNIIYAGDKKVMLIDIDDIFLIDSDDVIVVGKKKSLSNVNSFRDEL